MGEARAPKRLRPDPGILLAGAASIMLLLLLSRGWFGLEQAAPVTEDAVGVGLGRSFDAWVSFAWLDLFLLAVVAVNLAFLAMAFAGLRLRLRPGPVLVGLGIVSFLLISYRLVIPPWPDAEREVAPYLALLCCAAIAGGGHLSFLISSGKLQAKGEPKPPRRAHGR